MVNFRIFFIFGWKLALKRIMVVILMSFWFFWHPWHPWGWLSSWDIWVLRYVLNILLQWHRLADFFHFHQNDLPCQLYDLGPSNSDFVTINALKINNYLDSSPHQVEWSEHKKSQCVFAWATLYIFMSQWVEILS